MGYSVSDKMAWRWAGNRAITGGGRPDYNPQRAAVEWLGRPNRPGSTNPQESNASADSSKYTQIACRCDQREQLALFAPQVIHFLPTSFTK